MKFDHGVEYIPSTEDEEDVPPVSSQHYHRQMLQSYHQEEANETMFCPIPSEWDTLFLFSTLPGKLASIIFSLTIKAIGLI